MNHNSALKTGFSVFAFITFFLLLVLVTFAQPIPPSDPIPLPGGGIIVDTSFAQTTTSEECGSRLYDCVIAAFTIAFSSNHDPRVFGNETAFAWHIRDIAKDYGGYFTQDVINATMEILI